jgi:hypothetical protein
MDPNQAWHDLAVAIVEDDWMRGAEIADGLLDWLRKDGFPPTITGRRAFDVLVVGSTCESIAAWDC